MSWSISSAWAYLTCEEREPRITTSKILAHSGIRTLDLHYITFIYSSAYEADALSVELIRADNYQSPKGDRVLPEFSM